MMLKYGSSMIARWVFMIESYDRIKSRENLLDLVIRSYIAIYKYVCKEV